MKVATQHQIRLGARRVHYRVVVSEAAGKLRLRVGPNGVEVLQPAARNSEDVHAFLCRHEVWILGALERVQRMRGLLRPQEQRAGEILFRGKPAQILVEATRTRSRGCSIVHDEGRIVIRRGPAACTAISRSLESWFRQEARKTITRHLAVVTARLGREPGRVYVMGQRSKWGNCSAKGNLSFNWRLILAPDSVLRYIVTHEAVHLAVPDHSTKFWLTVQSLCPEMERARQWLCRHQSELAVALGIVLNGTRTKGRPTSR